MVLLDARVLVVDVQRRDHPVGYYAGSIPRGGALVTRRSKINCTWSGRPRSLPQKLQHHIGQVILIEGRGRFRVQALEDALMVEGHDCFESILLGGLGDDLGFTGQLLPVLRQCPPALDRSGHARRSLGAPWPRTGGEQPGGFDARSARSAEGWRWTTDPNSTPEFQAVLQFALRVSPTLYPKLECVGRCHLFPPPLLDRTFQQSNT